MIRSDFGRCCTLLIVPVAFVLSMFPAGDGFAQQARKDRCVNTFKVTGAKGASTVLSVRKIFQEMTDAERATQVNFEGTQYTFGDYTRVGQPSNLVDCAGWVFNKLWGKGQYVITAGEFYKNVVVPFGQEVSRFNAKPGDVVVYLDPSSPKPEDRGKHIAVVVETSWHGIIIETKDGTESVFRTTLPFNTRFSNDPLLRKYAETVIYRVDPSQVTVEQQTNCETPPTPVAVNTPTGAGDTPPEGPGTDQPTDTTEPPTVIVDLGRTPRDPPGGDRPNGGDGSGGQAGGGNGTGAGGGNPPAQPQGKTRPPGMVRPGRPPAPPPPAPPPTGATTPPPTVVDSVPPNTPTGPTSPSPPYKTHFLSEPFTPGGQCPSVPGFPTAFESCTFGPLNAADAPSDGWVGCVYEVNMNFVCKASNAPSNCSCKQDWSGRVPPLDQLIALAPADPLAGQKKLADPAHPPAGSTNTSMVHPNIVEPATLPPPTVGSITALPAAVIPNIVDPVQLPPPTIDMIKPATAKAVPESQSHPEQKPKKTAKKKQQDKPKRQARPRAPIDDGIDTDSARAAVAIGVIGGIGLGGGFRGGGGYRGGGSSQMGRHHR